MGQGASRGIVERLQNLKARLHHIVDRVLDKHAAITRQRFADRLTAEVEEHRMRSEAKVRVEQEREQRLLAERCRSELEEEEAEANRRRQEEEAQKLSQAMEETRALAARLHASEERLGDETAWVLAMAEAGMEAERAMRATRLKQVEAELHHAEAVYARIEAKNEIARTKLRVRSLIEAGRTELQHQSSFEEQDLSDVRSNASSADDLARALEVVAANRKRQEILAAARRDRETAVTPSAVGQRSFASNSDVEMTTATALVKEEPVRAGAHEQCSGLSDHH